MPVGYTEILCITIFIEELYIFAINFIVMSTFYIILCTAKFLVRLGLAIALAV